MYTSADSIIMLYLGGFILAIAATKTGLGVLYSFSNFILNTATSSLLVPILVVIGTAVADKLASFGGVAPLLIDLAKPESLAGFYQFLPLQMHWHMPQVW